MNWFKMHLNWAMVFGWLLAIGACFVMCMIYFFAVGLALSQGWMASPSYPIMTIGAVIFSIAAILLSLGVSLWACIQKGISRGWAFLWLIPFGFIVLLVLKNRRALVNPEGPPASVPPVIT